jgi:23S rRNA (cytosine1962-C5)-methyltransferase
VFEWLSRKPDREFDVIILDPPSLARREAERGRAITAYSRLATDAIRWLAQGGILFAASCSAHVTPDEFFEAVRVAARASGRRFTEMETTGHAADHPATFPEAEYLKGIYLRF